MNTPSTTIHHQRRRVGSGSRKSLLPLLPLLIFLLTFNAHLSSSAARKSQPPHASLAASSQPTLASVAEAGRPLKDYALCPLVLLTAIDGSLIALDRSTGETRWTLNSGGPPSYPGGSSHEAGELTDLTKSAFAPLVSTEYGKRHTSLAAILASSPSSRDDEELDGGVGRRTHRGDHQGFALDGLPSRTRSLLQAAGMYIVEPGSSGRLYLLTTRADEGEDPHRATHEQGPTAKARLQRVPLTLPELVALSPFSFPGDKGRVFTGTKRTRLLRINPLTGELDRSWEADGSELSNDSIHERGDHMGDDCKWAYLARSDYTLSIALPRRPHLSQTLHYSTYAPQSSDGEISSSWLQTYTNARLRGEQSPGLAADDGQLILPTGLDTEGRARAKVSGWNTTRGVLDHAWTRDIDSQVVDIFDVLLPRKGSAVSPHAHPVIVPHPPFALSEQSLVVGPDFTEGDVDGMTEETLLNFSPSTGSLYALSSRRFPGVLKDVTPALAGLRGELERVSQDTEPGGRAGSEHHQPMQCRTFGCWLGRYQVDEELFGDQDQTRKLLGPAMDRRLLDGQQRREEYTAPPLSLPEGSTSPLIDPVDAASPTRQAPLPLSERTASVLLYLGSSKKALATQAFALLILIGFALLLRRGTRVREQVQGIKTAELVEEAGLSWDPVLPAGRGTDPEWSDDDVVFDKSKEALSEPGHVAIDEFPLQQQQLTRNSGRQDAAADSSGNVVVRDPEMVASELIAEEEANASRDTIAKKKRRKRGKRSGAAVKARASGAGAANGEEDSASEDEKQVVSVNNVSDNTQNRAAVIPDAPRISDAETSGGPPPPLDMTTAGPLAIAASLPGPSTSTSALEISDEILGYGSSGTVVFKGKFQSRLVAVKRLLVDFVHLATQEISLLESADDHPNVIRYFYKEQKASFLFIALELCPASLADVVERPDEWKDLAVRLEPKKAVAQIASGLRHLHGLSIVHRDIKPQNILVAYKDPHQPSTSALKMLLSDFGLSKRLDSVAQSSFSQTMHHPGGTAGWRAPEILSGEVSLDEGGSSASTSTSNSLGGPTTVRSVAPRMRLTRGVDIFALGCVTYYLLTSGDHPFGARYEREVNILRNQKNLSRLAAFGEEGLEASHLITAMIESEPTQRPRAAQVLAHPYFWDAGKRLAFLQDVSDRIEVIDREKDRAMQQQLASSLAANGPSSMAVGAEGDRDGQPPSSSTSSLPAESELIRQLEVGAREVTAGGDWTKKVDKAFMDDLGKWRKYHGNSVRDLLRALRNKKHHYQDMPPALRRSMGHLPDGFLSYFTRRFPRLFLHVYEVVSRDGFVKSETSFKGYFARPEED